VATTWSPRPGCEPRRDHQWRPSWLDGATVIDTTLVSLGGHTRLGSGGGSSLRWHRGAGLEVWPGVAAVLRGGGAPVAGGIRREVLQR
jgi:hypothetical protein